MACDGNLALLKEPIEDTGVDPLIRGDGARAIQTLLRQRKVTSGALTYAYEIYVKSSGQVSCRNSSRGDSLQRSPYPRGERPLVTTIFSCS